MTIAHHELSLPEPGKVVRLTIPVVRHPGCFYGQLLKNGSDNCVLNQLNADMNLFYGEHTKNTRRPFLPGEVAVAQYSDGKWYRARLIETLEEADPSDDLGCLQKIRVFFVDYGHVYTVDVLALRGILSRFLELPFQAVECSLAGLRPPRGDNVGDWSKASRETFRTLTAGVDLCAKVNANLEARLEIELWRAADNGDWRNMAEELIHLGQALASPCKMTSS